MINETFVKRWIEALRSGEYCKTSGVHRRLVHGDMHYCFLGLGYVLAGGDKWVEVGGSEDGWGAVDAGIVPDLVIKTSGIDHAELCRIALYMNDGGKSFYEIAAHLEKLLPPAEKQNFARELLARLAACERIPEEA